MNIEYNGDRAKWALIIFYVMVAFTPILLISGYWEYQLLSDYDFTDEEAMANDLRQGILAIVYLGVYITAVVLFIRWFRRAYHNLHKAGFKDLQHTEGWAAGAWFVPILNLFYPYQMALEIWNKKQEAVGKVPIKSTLLGLWWGAWVVSNLVSNFVVRMTWRAESIEELRDAAYLSLWDGLLGIPALILVILVIRQISSFEEDFYKNGRNEEVNIEDHLVE